MLIPLPVVSRIIALSLAGLTLWLLLNAASPVEPNVAALVYATLTVLVAIMFALALLALHVGTAGSAIYWKGDPQPQQMRQIAIMIAILTAIQLVAGVTLDLTGYGNPMSSSATYLLVWSLVPAAFLQLGLIEWPTRFARAPAHKILIVGVPSAGFVAVVSYNSFLSAGADLVLPSIGPLFVTLGALLIGAAAEEVVFRVLLLTALLDRGVSRLQAVFLSGFAFAALHAPTELAQPVARGDWALLAYAAHGYAPNFLAQVVLGLVLGVIWLRTGSVTLITLIHLVLNIGPALAFGLAMAPAAML